MAIPMQHIWGTSPTTLELTTMIHNIHTVTQIFTLQTIKPLLATAPCTTHSTAYKIIIVSHMTLHVSLSGTLAVKCAHCAFCLNQQPHQPIITHTTAQQSCILQS